MRVSSLLNPPKRAESLVLPAERPGGGHGGEADLASKCVAMCRPACVRTLHVCALLSRYGGTRCHSPPSQPGWALAAPHGPCGCLFWPFPTSDPKGRMGADEKSTESFQ